MDISKLIEEASAKGASDIHLVFGLPPKFRLHGVLQSMNDTVLTDADCISLACQLSGLDASALDGMTELDIAGTFSSVRVRINLFSQQGHISSAVRLLSGRIPDLDKLGLPSHVASFTALPRGIVIVTGETGSGKSTTLAALLDRINHTRTDHIVTLEDPIEYIYSPDKCVINQREVGKDTESYAMGLRAALREDPDVILIGEMRDLDTIETALTAAETGHLVFATLHTNSAADSIDRIVDVFPEGRQRQIRMQLSMTLKAVLSQQLLPNKECNGRALACELMVVNQAIKNLIREGKTPQIINTIATSAQEGSLTMDNSLIKLWRDGRISSKTALEASSDPEYVRKSVGSEPQVVSAGRTIMY